ncbi:MAG: LysE family translocator [Proteobacteria bacterium]|jgi:threonine/homoserine/homoserine lactone efflux protein|nr:LysE family translocator [Pseudomonadota bacterium]
MFNYDAELMAGFVVFAMVTAITPGPNNFLLLSSGLHFGWRRSLPHVFGIIVGVSIVLIVMGLGLGQYLEANPAVHQLIRWPGVAVILYFAWKIITSTSLETSAKRYRPFTFVEACLFQWINPKALIIMLTMISAYTTPEYSVYSQLTVMVLISTVAATVATTSWVMIGVNLHQLLKNPKHLKVFNICMGLALVIAVLPIILNN